MGWTRDLLVPGPEIEPAPPAMEALSLNHWTAREIPPATHFIIYFLFYLFIFGCAVTMCWLLIALASFAVEYRF